MSKAHHAVERAQHAAHTGGHDGESPGLSGKTAGLTMAMIGVLIAFSAAMVGSERNELTRVMIEQTQASSISTSASTKFRLVMLELEKQRGTATSAAGAERQSTLHRLIRLYRDYSHERDLSKSWADSYQPMVDAHFDAAEGYERAQLIAEIGVVAASLAVLLANRAAWLFSVILAVGCVGQLGYTGVRTRSTVERSIRNVEHGSEAYAEVRKLHAETSEDQNTVDLLDPGGKIRATLD
jgi:hypothetical protein